MRPESWTRPAGESPVPGNRRRARYGRFYKSMLYPTLRRINDYLVRWAMQKYKRLHRHANRARRWLQSVARRAQGLFAHWRLGLVP